MVADKRIKTQRLMIIVIFSLLIISNAINITLAFFTSSKTASAVIVFGSIDVEATIFEDSNKLILTADEMLPGSTPERTLIIRCPNESEDFYMRMRMEFKVGDDVSDLVVLTVGEYTETDYWSVIGKDITGTDTYNWTPHTDGKIYFNRSVDKGQTIFIPLQFEVDGNMGQSLIKDKVCSIVIKIDVIQKVNGGYITWHGPAGWPMDLE